MSPPLVSGRALERRHIEQHQVDSVRVLSGEDDEASVGRPRGRGIVGGIRRQLVSGRVAEADFPERPDMPKAISLPSGDQAGLHGVLADCGT